MLDLANLRQYKENNRLEAKRAQGGLPHSIWETSSAFANTFGGYILLGVIENAGKSFSSVPLPDPERLAADFWNGVNNRAVTNANILSDRNVQIRESEGNRIVVIEVPRADRHDKPVYIGSDPFAGTYRRNGEGGLPLHAGGSAGQRADPCQLLRPPGPGGAEMAGPHPHHQPGRVPHQCAGGAGGRRVRPAQRVADQDVQPHQCGRARRQRPAQHLRRLAEAALENAGDHREFRCRLYHAAAAVGLGKNGDKKWRLKSGDKSGRIAERRKAEILQYLTDTPQATASEIARAIGLQESRTRQYLAGLTAEGTIVAEGANKGRRFGSCQLHHDECSYSI